MTFVVEDKQNAELNPLSKYDADVKRFFTLKLVIAFILKECVKEYAKFTVKEILAHLDKEHTRSGKYITTLNNEIMDAKGHGVRMDIVFHTRVPGSDMVLPIIINLEPQADSDPGYDIVSRGVFYGTKLISTQDTGKTKKEFYNQISKVYSIWICYNVSGRNCNSILSYETVEKIRYGNPNPAAAASYDKMQVWIINLGDYEQVEEGTLLRMLDIAFSKKKSLEKNKLQSMLKQEYNIEDKEFAEEVGHMNAFLARIAREEREQVRAEMQEEMAQKEAITSKIINILLDLGRIDEVRRVSTDASLRTKLIAEFGLN